MHVKLTEDQKIKIGSSADIYRVMQKILLRENEIDRDREHFWVISLNNAHKILNIELISIGTVNQTLVTPMEVISVPLQKRAVKLVLVHNHPSESLMPSEQDKDITDRLIQVGRIMNIPVLDHLIITEHSYYSFADAGLLATLAKSEKYVPRYELEERREKERLEKHRRQIERATEAAKKASAKSLARLMKKDGEPVERIMKYTGLSKGSIRQLKVED